MSALLYWMGWTKERAARNARNLLIGTIIATLFVWLSRATVGAR